MNRPASGHACGAEHPSFICELAQPEAVASGEPMSARQRDQHRLLNNITPSTPEAREALIVAQRQIDLTGAQHRQHAGWLNHRHRQLDLGQAVAELDDGHRHDRRRRGAQRRHTKPPGPEAEQVVQILLGVAQPRQDGVGVLNQ